MPMNIPPLGLGTWGMGGGFERDENDRAKSVSALKFGLSLGFRFIDTAEIYGEGLAEEIVGEAIAGYKREDIFLSTKVWRENLYYERLIQSAKQSLERLKTSFIDLYLIHSFNPEIPFSETMAALEYLINKGLVRHFGVSDFTVSLLREAQSCLSHNKIEACQIEYNLFNRAAEQELIPFCRQQGIKIIAYRPLAKGGLALVDDAILNLLAKKYKKTPAQIALNWLISQEVAAIPKATSQEHLKENWGALGWRLADSDMKLLHEHNFSHGSSSPNLFNKKAMFLLKKKLHTIRNLSWSWAFRYYKKRLLMNLSYYWSQFRGRSFWEINIDGLKLKMSFSHPYHHLFARRISKGKHEVNLLLMWKKQAEAVQGDILDLGGYSGIFGLIAAIASPHSKIYIFEPDPVNFKHIQDNIALNHFKNVFPVQAAVFDRSGPVSFKKHEGGEAGNIAKGEGDFQLPCVTIDGWVAQNKLTPVLIKMDVEGAEYRALLGSKKLLSEAENLKILLEVHYNFLQRFGDTEADIWRLLSGLGYGAIFLDICEYNRHYWVYKEAH